VKEVLMAVKVPPGWYDISVPLKQGMPYFPTDPVPPRIYRMTDRSLGSPVTMSMLEIISHTGTHIDSPLHFIEGGTTISDMPLDATIGPCRVIEIQDPEKISAAELEQHDINKGDRILCKTANSPRWYQAEKFIEDYVYLDDDAADYLAGREIVLFGLDNITIGSYRRPENIGHDHTTLLGAGIYVLEGLALEGVPAGEYELLCLPLLMYHGDAGPSRALLRPLKK
jgi:arylformamidase